MTYVSFVEIFQKSVGGFMDAGVEFDKAYIYSTLCFFVGVCLMVILNNIVHFLLDSNERDELDPAEEEESIRKPDHHENEAAIPHDPVSNLERVQRIAQELEEHDNIPPNFDDNINSIGDTNWSTRTEGTDRGEDDNEEGGQMSQEESRKLSKMSLATAIAIAIHNFPEGLATFVAAMDDPAVGAVLAIAIMIHNVPEGLCVSLPVYYATGNRFKAFLWGCLSGASEPVAALLGWAVLANSFSDEVYGILFGVVSGMMVIISVRELLPTAHRYDPEDQYVTNSFIVGMSIMALSLVLFLV